MTFETAKQLESAFHNLPNDARARRAFTWALAVAGHKFVYLERANGDRVTAFRVYNDDGNRFPEEIESR